MADGGTQARVWRSMTSMRQQVLGHAGALLEERGLQNFTIAEVANRASISIGDVLHRLKTKGELIRTPAHAPMSNGRKPG